MWPWGHAALGYIVYSLFARLRHKEVSPHPVLVLVLATQVPDLVDKPLAWLFGIGASGYGPGHSIFVAIPIGALIMLGAARRRVSELGVAVLVGWWSHLVGDVLVAVIDDRNVTIQRVLWPITPPSPSPEDLGVIERVLEYLTQFIDRLIAGDVGLVGVLYVAPVLLALVLWFLDGTPGMTSIRLATRRNR